MDAVGVARPREAARRVRLIDTDTAAVALGCTGRHVRRLIRDGGLTNHGSERRIRLDVDEVYDLARRRRGKC